MDRISFLRGNAWIICLLLLFARDMPGQLIMNEMMASNASTLEDQFNEFPDWIEIYNAGSEAIQLENYWLSDDLSEPRKWNLPGMLLEPGAYYIIFASGRDIRTGLSHWHTVVNTGEEWKYLAPQGPVDNVWRTSTDYTSGWNTGKAGIGYSDGDDSTIISTTVSLYMQKEFQVASVDQVTDAVLFMDYDDGFVAYLNGTEIARSFNMGIEGRDIVYNNTATSGHEANMYNGQPPEQFFLTDHIDALQEGSNILAIQVHNVNPTSSDMSSNPFLLLGFSTFQENLLYKNPYLLIRDKYPHANFKIRSEGEALYLTDESGTLVDQIANVQLPTDFSYGRVPGTADQFGYYAAPTPGAPNGADCSLNYFTDSVHIVPHEPDFSPKIRIHMESAIADDEIYFTLDGSEPDQDSPVFPGIQDLTETTVVKARIFRPNSLPGPVTTRTFFVGDGHDLPLISVSMDPYDLWDYNNGMYVMGPNAGSETPHHGANFWQDWERPAYFELYDTSHQVVLAQNAGTKIFGGWSRAHPQKSMSFFARKNYGDGSFSCQLFKEKPIDEFEAFVLRNSGNDWCNGNFRDALTAYLAADMDVDHQAYQPYVMYLNGEYWGFINMREKVNEHFVASNHHVYADDVNLLVSNSSLVHGNPDRYVQMHDFISTHDLSNAQNYSLAKGMMDVNNYMNYWALNVYIDNKDWPGNNIKYWNTTAPGSLFRWISYDTDFGYSIWDHQSYTVNTLRFSFGEVDQLNWANQEWATSMIRSLVANPHFRRQFINAFADRMNTTFHPDYVVPVIDSFEQRLISEAPAHYDRWIGDPNNWLSFPNWLASVERMRTYFRERPLYMRQHLMARFNLNGVSDIEIRVSDENAGHVRLNTLDLNSSPFTGTYFNGVPVRLEAVPAPGHVFSHWAGGFSGDTTVFSYDMSGPAQFMAVFEAVDSSTHIVINEINYASSPAANTEDWIELYNHSGVAVDLSGWALVDGFTQQRFTIAQGTVMPAGSYMVFSRHRPDFKRFHPEMQPLMGDLPFGLSSEGDGIALNDADGEMHDHVIFGTTDPWPEAANGSGMTLELTHPDIDNNLPESWKVSLDPLGTPNALNSQFAVPEENKDTTDIAQYTLSLAGAYPSPFRDQVHVVFTLDHQNDVSISVYNASGQMVGMVADRLFPQGEHRVTWNPEGTLAPGLYFVHLRTGAYHKTFKVVHQ